MKHALTLILVATALAAGLTGAGVGDVNVDSCAGAFDTCSVRPRISTHPPA